MFLITVGRATILGRYLSSAAYLTLLTTLFISSFPANAQDTANLKLFNCLCGCQKPLRSEFSCSYDPTRKGGSPSCDDPKNGACICEALGCFRTKIPTGGSDCVRSCSYRYSPWSGSVQAVSGNVTVQRYGSNIWVALTKGMTLGGGDRVKTGPDGRIALAWKRDTQEKARVTLMAGTEFYVDTYIAAAATGAFDADPGRSLYRLIAGKIKMLTVSLFGSEWKSAVQTKNTIAGIRGTEFIVQYDAVNDTDTYFVHRGTVEVRTSAGSVSVGAGKRLIFRKAGGRPIIQGLDEASWQKIDH
jgi:hypothetical protein